MSVTDKKPVEYLVVDTTAFIQNAPLQDFAKNIITCQDVVDEITSKRQLKRLVVLPYDLQLKEPFSENIKIVTDFSIKTGDYPSLSATDIKVMALTYQLEKEKVGTGHLRSEPIMQKSVISKNDKVNVNQDITGFYMPHLLEKVENLQCDDILKPIKNDPNESNDSSNDNNDDNDEDGWITPSNIDSAKKQLKSGLTEEKNATVSCITTDFAMQNVLKQMNLNICALDGRLIKQLRTFILRCYACFKTTSLMTKQFCPKCGNNTLKKVAVSLNEKGEMQIHINARKPLTARGKNFSLPRIRGGKHPNNPILVPDQPMADNKPSRLAKTKLNPLDDDYIAGFSPFVMRDVTSRSALLCIRPGGDAKNGNWVRKNPNENRRKRK